MKGVSISRTIRFPEVTEDTGGNMSVTMGNTTVARENKKKAKIYKLSTSNLITRRLDMVIRQERDLYVIQLYKEHKSVRAGL